MLRGRFEPLEVVRAGGQGRVVRALDHQHDRLVALKVRRVEPGEDTASLLAEARLLLGLTPNPGLPLARDDFFDGEDYYLVVDWVEGDNLDDIAAREGGLPLADVCAWLEQAATVLDHMHGHDPPVVHLDVKPANLIRSPSGRIVLVDLGIAGRVGGVLAGASGTRAFRAPEVVSGAIPTPAADVFGLAATALALLAGAPPEPGPRPGLPGVPHEHLDRVWAAINAGLAYDPARRPASASAFVRRLVPPDTPTNLPAELTTFVGRTSDVGDLVARVEHERLVTIAGPGGIGKTRLAVRVANEMLEAFAGGVWIVELAPLADPELVLATVSRTLGVVGEAGRAPADSLVDALGSRRVLILLDNCEHLLDAVAALAALLVTRCRSVHILLTSRQPIGVTGEAVHRLEPLAVPGGDGASAAEVAGFDAVRLFHDRARLASADFQLTDEVAADVSRICRSLDGLPLAIELAAARITHLRPAQLASRLHDRFRLLTTGSRTAAARQQTLRAAVDWSYELLEDEERSLFDSLAVFSGSFSLEAAEAVAHGDVFALDVLASLVSKSLLATSVLLDETRYRMLETVRAYAADRLEASGRSVAARADALDWAESFARRAAEELGGTRQSEWLARVEAEHDNLRSAVAWAIERGLAGRALSLALSLARFWEVRGHWVEGRRVIEQAAALSDASGRGWAHALVAAATLARCQGDLPSAEAHLAVALRLAAEAGERDAAAAALGGLGAVAEARGDYERARELHVESLDAFRALGHSAGVAEQLLLLGRVWECIEDYPRARELVGESLGVYRSIGDTHGIAFATIELGYILQYQGEDAEALFQDGLALYRAIGDRQGTARALLLLAIRRFMDQNPVAALELGQQSLEIRVAIGDRTGVAIALESLAGLAAFLGQGERSARLFGAAAALRETIGAPVSQSDRNLITFAHSLARSVLGEDTYERLVAEGRRMPLDDAVTEALAK